MVMIPFILVLSQLFLVAAAAVPSLDVPPCTAGKARIQRFWVTNETGMVAPTQQTTVDLCYDHLGFRVTANATDRHVLAHGALACDSPVWEGGSVFEVFMAPVASPFDAPQWYHEMDTAPSGTMWVGHINNTLGNASNCGQSCGAAGPLACSARSDYTPAGLPLLKSLVSNVSSGWQISLFVPFRIGAYPSPHSATAPPQTWRANFYRCESSAAKPRSNTARRRNSKKPARKASFCPAPAHLRRDSPFPADAYPSGADAPPELSGWSPTHDPSFHVPARFGVLRLVDESGEQPKRRFNRAAGAPSADVRINESRM